MTNCSIINSSFTNSELIKKFEKAGYKIRVSQKLDIVLSGSPSIAFTIINLKSYILPEIIKKCRVSFKFNRILQQSKQFQYSVVIMQCKTDCDINSIMEIQRNSYIYISTSNDNAFQIMTQMKSIITNDIGSKKDALIKSIAENCTTRVSASNVLKVIPNVKPAEADLLIDSLGSIYNVVNRMSEGLHHLSPISEVASNSIMRFFEESDDNDNEIENGEMNEE